MLRCKLIQFWLWILTIYGSNWAKINNSKSPQFVVVLQLTDNRLKILDLVLRRLHRGFCLILAHFSVYFSRKFLCFWFFKLTKSHQKVTSKDRTIICCNKYWQNDFSDRSKRNFFLSSEDRKKANILKIITFFPKAHFGGGSFSSQQSSW